MTTPAVLLLAALLLSPIVARAGDIPYFDSAGRSGFLTRDPVTGQLFDPVVRPHPRRDEADDDWVAPSEAPRAGSRAPWDVPEDQDDDGDD